MTITNESHIYKIHYVLKHWPKNNFYPTKYSQVTGEISLRLCNTRVSSCLEYKYTTEENIMPELKAVH